MCPKQESKNEPVDLPVSLSRLFIHVYTEKLLTEVV